MSTVPAAALDALGLESEALDGAVELVPFVSPGHRATGNRVLLLGDAVLRVPSADAAALRSASAGVAAARRAGELGLGPRVVWSDPETGVLVLERADGAREARIEDLWGPFLGSALAALRAFHATPALGHPTGLRERLDDLAGRLEATDAPRPPDLDALVAGARSIAAAMASSGVDPAPCHLHPVASNLLVRPDGTALLVDWDEAGDADPWWDLGALLQEACTFDDEWHAGAERAVGRADPASVARLRLYGLADDVLWGLWAALLGGTSPRREIEFFKYASWRFMRARRGLADERMGTWLRTA